MTNRGNHAWTAAARAGIAPFEIGVQLLGPDRAVIARDHFRQQLPADIAPGAQIVVRMDIPAPAGAAVDVLKIELVAEGVTWFEPGGSQVAFIGPCTAGDDGRVACATRPSPS